jgi:GMP synthase (glutamine-hydrolysing)
VAWTGSNLSILDADNPEVSRQVELAARLIKERVPSFGSCFAIQLASVALGGSCRPSPNGREFGVSRRIQLSDEGRAHPLYRDKPPVFDAFTSHADEVAVLPPHTRLLASNEWSPVQAASLEGGAVPFWVVQYHPEYDLHEVASLCRLRKPELVAQGTFASEADATAWIEDLEALHADPTREDLAASLDVGEALLDESQRTVEVRNWIESQVR